MDFLDFPALVATEEPAALPQPASRLSLETLGIQGDQQEQTFVLPSIDNDEAEFSDLHSKMKHFASVSLQELKHDSLEDKSNKTSTSAILTNIEKPVSTNQLLSKKINDIVNASNYSSFSSDSEVRYALQILEKNHSNIAVQYDQLVASDFVGVLHRKSLRSKLENSMLNSHSEILSNFHFVARRIKRLSEPLERINKAMEHINEADTPKVFEFDQIREKLEKLKARREVVVKLRDSLTLNQLELDNLQNGNIDDSFFKILDKINFIKEKATYLLSDEKTTAAGTSLLKSMNNYLMISNKRMYNYLLNFIDEYDTLSRQYGERTIGDEALSKFQTSLVHLSSDVQFLQDFLSRISTLRSKRLLDDFLSQFDIDNKKLQRPIILSAHDPVRYLGDVLAYLHSMIVNELEFLKSIFKLNPELITSDSILKDNMEYVQDLHLKLLNKIFASLSNTVRIRLEQIVRFENDPLLNLDIVQCLSLYQMMFTRSGISEPSILITSIHDLENLARSKVITSLSKYLNDLNKDQMVPNDLLPPDWFSDYLSKLSQIMSKIDQQNETKILTKDFYDKLIVEPVDQMLTKTIHDWFPNSKKDKSEKINMLIAQINSLDLIKSKMGAFHNTLFADGYGANLYDKINSQYTSFASKLKDLMMTYLLDSTGMEIYYNLFNMIFPIVSVQDELDHEMYLSAIENPIMKLPTVSENVHHKLNEYIPFALTDFQDAKLYNLLPPSIEEDIVSSCFDTFIKFYIIFKSVLFKLYPDRVEDVSTTLNFSGDEVATLLAVKEE